MSSSIGYCAFLSGPPLIGFLGDAVAALLVLAALIAGTVHPSAARPRPRSGVTGPGPLPYSALTRTAEGDLMSDVVARSLMSGLTGLRHQPSAKRVRAKVGDRTLVDSTRAALVWEPRRVVPSWGVPAEDVAADLVPSPAAGGADGVGYAKPEVSQRPVLDPSIPFGVHTADGAVVDLLDGSLVLSGAGFRPADQDLDGYVVLDFTAFDTWWEEDELNVGHPRDPFHRIDILRSSRRVRVELDGDVLAESQRPRLLFETMLPARFYLPPEDVVVPMRPSPTRTTCAYKGHASYLTPVAGGQEVPDLAWSYLEPLREAAEVAGMVAFFDERVDLVLDGVPRPRPVTPWSDRRPR